MISRYSAWLQAFFFSRSGIANDLYKTNEITLRPLRLGAFALN
jgi:hypothetical protein